MTLDEAKAELLAIDEQIVSLVPEHLVAERVTHEPSATRLLRCGDGLQYPGQVTLKLVPGDYSQYVVDAGSLISNLPGRWRDVTSATDHPRVQLKNSDTGMSFLVSIVNGEFSVLSFSACFPEFEGYNPHKEY